MNWFLSRWLGLLIWLGPSALLIALVALVQCHYRIVPIAPLSPDERAAVIVELRAALTSGVSGEGVNAALARPLPHRGPMIVTLVARARPLWRGYGYGDTVAAATQHAAAQLAAFVVRGGVGTDASGADTAVTAGQLKVDIVTGRGPFVEGPEIARALGIHPGLEGLGVSLRGALVSQVADSARDAGDDLREVMFAPDDLIHGEYFGSYRPLAFIHDFTLGLDFERLDMRLAQEAALPPGGYGQAARTYFRLRTDSFVEPLAKANSKDAVASVPQSGAGEPPLALVRGRVVPGPAVTAASLRAGALDGGRYLLDHLADNGRYIYLRHLSSGKGTNPHRAGPYSIPRHAGTTYYLAELYRLTGAGFLHEPIERAFAHLAELIGDGHCRGPAADGAEFVCVIDRGRRLAHLGASALTVVALAEYQRATADEAYLPLARELTAFLTTMQRPDGTFAHLYDIAAGVPDPEVQLFYYAGEAALALARMYELTGDRALRDGAMRALDALVDWYDFFAGGFFYGEEHWTCIAAEALYTAERAHHARVEGTIMQRSRRYLRFCRGYAAFLRQQQIGADEFADQGDYAGSYNVTPFLIPQNTPAGSRTEAVISTYLLGQYLGVEDGEIRAQIMAAMAYSLRQQFRLDDGFAVHESVPNHGIGAVPATPTDRNVRIDFVQHVGSAMIRTAAFMGGQGESR